MKETKDWGSIPFGYTPLRSRYEAVYKDGRWIENGLVGDAEIKLSALDQVILCAQQLEHKPRGDEAEHHDDAACRKAEHKCGADGR